MLFLPKASFSPVWVREVLASVKGQVVVWGNQANIKGSSDLYESNFQIQFTKFQELPRYHLISRQRGKQVSSTVGHDLMHDPYAERRFAQAHDNLDQLIAILKAEI
jgi:diphosphomevalonate decarboxylase